MEKLRFCNRDFSESHAEKVIVNFYSKNLKDEDIILKIIWSWLTYQKRFFFVCSCCISLSLSIYIFFRDIAFINIIIMITVKIKKLNIIYRVCATVQWMWIPHEIIGGEISLSLAGHRDFIGCCIIGRNNYDGHCHCIKYLLYLTEIVFMNSLRTRLLETRKNT
jgi:hypothetical protein